MHIFFFSQVTIGKRTQKPCDGIGYKRKKQGRENTRLCSILIQRFLSSVCVELHQKNKDDCLFR